MNNITVYTTSSCPYCVMLTHFLKEQNLPFQEVNIEKDPKAMQKVVAKTGQMGVPQTEINGQWIIGFDPDAIMSKIR